MRRKALWLLVLICLIPMTSLAAVDSAAHAEQVMTIYPVTTGHSRRSVTPISKIIVLSPQTGSSVAGAVAAGKDVFQRGGLSVIEKTPPASQGIQGPRRRDQHVDDGEILAFGKRVGADHVMVIEVTDTLVLDEHGSTKTTYLHDERVSVKGLEVKTGSLVLEGTARWSQPIERAGDHIRELTTYAIARAICAPDKWVEASPANQGRGRCRG